MSSAHRWVVVADSVFWPARVGGHREHTGFVDAAVAAGRVAVLVVPVRPTEEVPATYGAGGHDVPVIALPRDVRRRRMLSLREPFVVTSRPTPAWLLGRVRELAPDADAVVAFSYKVHRLGEHLAVGLGVPAVLRQHNLEAHYHRELARGTRGPRGWLLRWEARRIDRDERRLEQAPWLTGIADISATDAAARRLRASPPVRHVGPFAIAGVADVDRSPEGCEVLFLGALDVATNHDGLRWFTDHVWPRVLAAVPDARLAVVGSNPPLGLLRELLAVPSTTVHPDVPDTRPFLRTAAVAVNPTVAGSGVNIKLVDYLAAAIPTVTTSPAAAALALAAAEELGIADTAEAFADAVAARLRDPAAAQAAAVQRAEEIRTAFAPERGLALLAELLA